MTSSCQQPRHQVARIGVFRLPSTKTSGLAFDVAAHGEVSKLDIDQRFRCYLPC